MIMQNFGVTNREHYGMLWYFLEWSIVEVIVVRYASLYMTKQCSIILLIGPMPSNKHRLYISDNATL